MATAGTKRDDDSDVDKPAEKKVTPGGAPDVSCADPAVRPEGRFHLFPGKRPSTNASKPGGGQAQRLSCESSVRVDPMQPAGRVEIVVRVHRPSIDFKQELIRFQDRLAKGKKALHVAAMKAEDLDALVQGLRNTQARLARKRELLELGKSEFRKTRQISYL